MNKIKRGGGWRAILYALKKSREAGGFFSLWKAMRSKNACKTCALGMGGQRGGMVNEAGHFPEVCKKGLQAMVADMQGSIQSKFFESYPIAQLQNFSSYQLEHSGRLVQPLLLKKGAQHFQPIDWEDAINRITSKLLETDPNETFWYFSGRSSNEAGFLLQLFARMYGTNHVNNCSYYCHQASSVGLASVLGTGAGTIQLDDIEKADLFFLIGGNPASNHPRLMRSLMKLRRHGGKIIVINPIIETGLVNFSIPSDPISLIFGSKIANIYVQPNIGGDLALMYGLLKCICEMTLTHPEAIDEIFLSKHTQGWPELRAKIDALSWEEIVEKSGVPQAQILDVGSQYVQSKRCIFAWTMGVTHHQHGTSTVQAIAALALARGMMGKPGAGLQPIRGHSNIQGMGTVGVTPKLKEAVFYQLEHHFGIQLPASKGYDTLECIHAANAGKMRFAMCLGGNLYGASPNALLTKRAIHQVDSVVYLSTSLNTGHVHALGAEETLILPVLARDEEPEPSTQESMFSYIRLSDGGKSRHTGPRSEVEIIAEIAERYFNRHLPSPIDWHAMKHTRTIRKAIAQIVPGLEQLNDIDTDKKEFSIPNRTIKTSTFPTPDGKAQLFTHELPNAPQGMQLMTIRSEGQFNTVVYEEEDLYRNQTRRNIILIHPNDISKLGLKNGEYCRVISAVGQMRGVVVAQFDQIKPGNVAMYFPESNVLVPEACDPQSRTPAFKNVSVKILRDLPPIYATPDIPKQKSTTTTREKMQAC